MALCVAAAGQALTLAVSAFTLGWTHSVEKTAWQEDWRVTPAGLELVEARVQGSGAGMEPPADAVFENGWWRYRPAIAPLSALRLAASGATGGGWRLCAAGTCRELGAAAGEAVTIRPCAGG